MIARQIEFLTPIEQTELEQHEATIERGLKTFYDVGTALLAIREKRLYKAEYNTFEDYCQTKWQLDRVYAYRLMSAAQVANNLLPMGNIPENERQARPLTELEPDEQRIVWEVVQQTAPAGKVTAAHVKSVANVFKDVVKTGAIDDGSGEQIKVADVVTAAITEETYERMMRQRGYIEGKLNGNGNAREALHSSNTNEWYTPPQYIEAARAVMGTIDLDPASHEKANQGVKATTFYTIHDNGLAYPWNGRVWLNPPYGKDGIDSNQKIWTTRLINQYTAGVTTEAILLVNAATDTEWFAPLWDYPICFTNHRIRFIDENGEQQSQPTHGNVFVYFGSNVERFTEEFSKYGVIAKRLK